MALKKFFATPPSLDALREDSHDNFAPGVTLKLPPSYFSDLLSGQPRDRVLRDALSNFPKLFLTLPDDLFNDV